MTIEAIDCTIDSIGFAPQRRARAKGRRAAMIAEAVTLLALALSTLVAMAAVSIGIARAEALSATAAEPAARIAAAILFALVLVGIGGLTALLSQPTRSGAQPNAPVIDKLGMTLVRVLPDEMTPPHAPNAQPPMFAHAVLPSGRTGYVAMEQISPIGFDRICCVKDAAGCKITGHESAD